MGGGDRSDELSVEEGAELRGLGHLADPGMRQLPAVADLLDRGQLLRADDRDHPLLALGDHDLPGLHLLLAQRDAVEVDVDAAAAARHLRERGREPGRAAVLERDDQVALDELEARLDQLLARERVADLDGRPLVRVLLSQLLTGEDARAADAVAAGRRAVEEDDVPGAARLRLEHALGGEEPDAHRVHEAVVRVGGVEDRLAADRRHADAVPVVADSGHGSLEHPAGLAEAEPVEERDRPRAHRDDVAQDPADPGRGALERLDRGRMVVALDLERDRLAVAEIDDARVLARALEHARRVGREALQEQRRVLVAAVLGPEQREDRELEVVRLALEQLLDTVEFPVGQAEGAVERLFGDPRQEFESNDGPGWGRIVDRPLRMDPRELRGRGRCGVTRRPSRNVSGHGALGPVLIAALFKAHPASSRTQS